MPRAKLIFFLLAFASKLAKRPSIPMAMAKPTFSECMMEKAKEIEAASERLTDRKIGEKKEFIGEKLSSVEEANRRIASGWTENKAKTAKTTKCKPNKIATKNIAHNAIIKFPICIFSNCIFLFNLNNRHFNYFNFSLL